MMIQSDALALPLADCSVDSIVTDPPYGLGFMGHDWDSPGAKVEYQDWCAGWGREALRVARPGAFMLAFGGTRTYHRLTCGLEDSGWEVRDCLMWLYGSGFPKSLDISKAIDKSAGAERENGREKIEPDGYRRVRAAPKFNGNEYAGGQIYQGEAVRFDSLPTTDAAKEWSGWGTALKPAWEPIVLAMKPIEGTFAANVQRWGVGALNIDGGRIGTAGEPLQGSTVRNDIRGGRFVGGQPNPGDIPPYRENSLGRWPANLILDPEAAAELDRQSGEQQSSDGPLRRGVTTGSGLGYGGSTNVETVGASYGDRGGASRFFYCAKASRAEREAGLAGNGTGRANPHPTVKPVDLMRYLCGLVTPAAGLVLDCFAGSGSTGCGAALAGRRFIGIEREAQYIELARRRVAWWRRHGEAAIDRHDRPAPDDHPTLFG